MPGETTVVSENSTALALLWADMTLDLTHNDMQKRQWAQKWRDSAPVAALGHAIRNIWEERPFSFYDPRQRGAKYAAAKDRAKHPIKRSS